MLVDRDDFVLDGAAILAAASRMVPQAAAGTVVEMPAAGRAGSLVFTLGGLGFIAVPVGRSVPGDEIGSAAAMAYWWPSAAMQAARHRGHILLAPLRAQGAADAAALVQSARLVTALTAAVSEVLPGCIGALWAPSQVLQGADTLGAFAAMTLPLSLWLDIRLFRGEGDALGVVVRGLRPFLGRDLRLEAISGADPLNLTERAIGVAQYVLEGGATLADGDTMGVSADERIRVRWLGAAGEADAMLSLTVERWEGTNGR